MLHNLVKITVSLMSFVKKLSQMTWEDLAIKLLEKRNLIQDRQPRFMRGNMPTSHVGDFQTYFICNGQLSCFVLHVSVKNLIILYIEIYPKGKEWEKSRKKCHISKTQNFMLTLIQTTLVPNGEGFLVTHPASHGASLVTDYHVYE